MKVSPQAGKGHLIVGGVLALIALSCMIAAFFLTWKALPALVFFFGVWGGVEMGRYLEHVLTTSKEPAPERDRDMLT
jgi:hypothetical protein